MDNDKAIRAAKLTLGAIMEKRRAKSAVERAQGQIAPSKYLPGVPRQVHADGGSAGMGDNGGPPLSEPPVDLGAAREQKQLQTFHKGLMGDIGTRMTQAMEAHQKAVDAGHFDGYEVGDVLQGRGSPLKITGRYVQQWKPSRMTLEHFDRLGAKPSIIEHEGKQYIPMLRYTSGSEEGGDNQEGSLYLDAVKATGMRKMGGLRAVKANGGAIHLIHGGSDFDEIDPRYSGTGEPGNIRPLGKGLYTFVLDPDDPESAKDAIGWAKRYATKYGRGKKTLHVFQVPKSASTTFNGPRVIEGMGDEPQDKLDAYRAHRNAEPAKDDPAWWDWSRKGNALYDEIHNAADLRMEHLPIGLTEAAINNPKIAQRVGKFDPEADPDEIIKAIRGYADGGRVDEDVDGIDAYHGSPHDFDEFDIGKLGTGEGAQSYGHGLYFAGNEGVAKHYRDVLSDRNAPLGSFKKRDGSELDILHTPNGIYSLLGGDEPRNTDYDRLIAAANEKLQWAQSRKGPLREVHSKNAQEVLDFLKANEGLRFERNPARGHMYKVKLNVKPHELLDWDKPLSEQHPNVQAAIKAMGVDTGAREWKTGADLGNGNRLVVTPHPDLPEEQFAKYEMQTPEGSRFKLTRSDVERLLGKSGDLTGAQIHQRLVDMGNRDGAVGEHLRAGNPMKTGPKWASEVLMRHGIKGIRYRDAGSRNMDDGDPTHNYVMFHHDPVKVVDKYALGGYVPQKTQKAYKLFRTKGDGKLYPLFVHADKPVEMGKWLEAEEGPQGKAQGKVKSKLGDLAYRPGWHAGDLPIATHIGGKSDPSLKKPDYRPDNHVWAEVEMAADKDWQAEADSRGKGVKAHITDQVPLKGFYRYKTNPNMTGNWLIGGHMKVNRVLSDDEVKQINDAAGTADLPRLAKADGGSVFGGMTRDQFLGEPKITSDANAADLKPRALPELDDVDHEAFPLHGLRAKYSENGAAVFDGEKPVASYNFGNTLVVDPKYRKRGIGSELVYQWRSRFPQAKPSQYRTRTAQRIQEKVWDRIQREGRADGGIVERSPMFEGMSEHLMDDEGKPLDLWHGTPVPEGFDQFDDSKVGSRDHGFYGRGHNLTPLKSMAEGYTGETFWDDKPTGKVLGPFNAELKNPFVWDVSDENKAYATAKALRDLGVHREGVLPVWDHLRRHEVDDFMDAATARGHDGVIYRGPKGVREIVVFKGSQIKPRPERAGGGKVDLYSKAAKIIRGLKDQPMQVEDIIKYARGKGAKQAEIEHSNIPKGNYKLRPSEMADYIEGMQPQIAVIKKGQNYRYGSDNSYLSAIRNAERAGNHDLAEELNREWEAFAGVGLSSQPQYAKYQLPGGQNYREHILTLENHEGPTFTANRHWGRTPNPLAHIRMSDRIIGNKKILHVEEMQSDWNTQARKRGISDGSEQRDLDNFIAGMRQKAIANIDPTASDPVKLALQAKYQAMDPHQLAMKLGMSDQLTDYKYRATPEYRGAPAAPYIHPDRDDWAEMAMKHVLTEAAKGGYDGIAFTPDRAQEERWPGHTFKNMYDSKFPNIARKLVRQHDESIDADGDPVNIQGWGAPHVELTDKARDSILQNGFASFRRGGYVTHVRRAR